MIEANLPLAADRKVQVRAVAGKVLKRPAASQKQVRKRTPFTLERTGRLILGGVKNTVFRKVHKRPSCAS